MGTLSSELGRLAGQLTDRPRIYADANIPAGLVSFMRTRLGWDVLFVLEDEALRRARDGEHYRLARELRRTLVTLDRDYLDDARFPAELSGGVLIIVGPDERALARVLRRVSRELFAGGTEGRTLPLAGRKLLAHADYGLDPPRPRSPRGDPKPPRTRNPKPETANHQPGRAGASPTASQGHADSFRR